MRFDFVGDTQKGILYHLKNDLFAGDSVKYYEEVQTYATSSADAIYNATNAIDFIDGTYWHAKDGKDIGTEYIVIYLKSYYISLSGFSITSSNYTEDKLICHPKNWGFDASNDNVTWEHQINYTDTSGYMNRTRATEYVGWNYGIYKYFRITNTGEQYDGGNKNAMDLAQVEFFGDLLTKPYLNPCSIKILFLPNPALFAYIALI